jgi:hypothetical protein
MMMNSSDIDLLISRVLEGEATSDEVCSLHKACEEDPVLCRRLERELRMHRWIGAMIAAPDGDARFAAELVARIQSESADGSGAAHDGLVLTLEKRMRKIVWFSHVRRSLAFAAVLALAFWLIRISSPSEGVVLTRSESVVWTGDQAAPGDKFENGRILEIASGIAEMKFPSGVSVLLEGPAWFQVTGDKSGRLGRGKLVARVTERKGRGFVIDGPSGRVVDLGTEFGVSVEQSGEMEVHVLDGAVTAASHQKKSDVVTLHKHEAMRLGGGSSHRMAADDGFFITDLPPVPGRAPGFIRWSFEEPDVMELLNTGRGLAEEQAGAILLSGSGGNHYAKRIEGRFGRALAFDGHGSYAESGFQGVIGQAPRTVSLWARIPKDLAVTESYGMIGWGRVEGDGSAWQISANPVEDEGPLGALRVGTGRAAVVGSTDLRDGKWHHLTAVMYGGSPTTATHVLLYVDGVLESTTRKSVKAIDTEISKQAHGVWMGRNLSHLNPNPSGASFFRGDLDEVYIFAAALDQKMIGRLIEGVAPEL